MELNVIWKHARTAALECCEGSVYEMEEPCRISLNGLVSEIFKEHSVMNIYDISQKAGVSIATVSRVLNGSEKVSEKTRKKVLAVMDA